MFPKKKRFSRAVFPSALKSGRRISSEHFSAVFPGEGRGYAVVVSKKTARLSVTRHRIKRRISAALRTLPLPPSLILFPRVSTLDLSYDALRSELAGLLSR